MSAPTSAGQAFRAAVDAERPLQVVGAINAYAALLAERAGFRALYLSGAGVANASYGLPDLGHHDAERRAGGRAADHRASAACRCWWTPTPAGAAP